MEDLGKLQSLVKAGIRKANEDGDGRTLGRLGPVAADMDEKAREWASILNLAPNGLPPRTAAAVASLQVHTSSQASLAGKQIYSVTILGTKVPVGSYKHALFAVVDQIRMKHADFDQLALQVRGHLPYFSTNPLPKPKGELRKPKPVSNSKLFIETNVGSDRISEICRRLVRTFGYNPDDLSVLGFEVAPARTRARKTRRTP